MTDEAIVYPDAVDVAITWLTANLGPIVLPRVPNPRLSQMVIVRRTGGARLNLVADNPTLTVEAWAQTDEDAHDLAQEARGYLLAMRGEVIGGVTVYRTADVGGPGLLPDPLSTQSRYTFSVSAAMRGTALAFS